MYIFKNDVRYANKRKQYLFEKMKVEICNDT